MANWIFEHLKVSNEVNDKQGWISNYLKQDIKMAVISLLESISKNSHADKDPFWVIMRKFLKMYKVM